ncbi:MAG: DUF1800 family protein, partial [Pseudomonadota bacterium]
MTSFGGGTVSSTGTTLFGSVQDPGQFDMVSVTVEPSGRTAMVDVGPTTGQFAVRLFANDFASGSEVSVTLQGGSTVGASQASEPITYELTGSLPTDGIVQALSRMSFGATPTLYSRVREMGFEAYVQEQLNPGSINDNAYRQSYLANFNAANVNCLSCYQDNVEEYLIARATYTQRQLQEVIGAFWANHFHANTKMSDIRRANFDDRVFFRENAFGKFEDLLTYSARSPLMSQYLDNDTSRKFAINENFACVV